MRVRKTVLAGVALSLILGGAAAGDTVRRFVLPTNDLIYNPVDGHIYASVPSRAGVLGNRIVAIVPERGWIVSSIPVGSEPGKLALSEDGHYLYVGLDGAGAVRRVDLVRQTADLQFSMGRQGPFQFNTGPNIAGDLKVLPGHPESVVVSRITSEDPPRGGGVAVYDDGVPRPQILDYFNGKNVIVFGEPPSRLYGYDQFDSSIGFRWMTVDASGVLPGGSIPDLISGAVDIQYDLGRIYTSSGLIIDPEAAMVVGRFPGIPPPLLGTPPRVPLRADAAEDRVYFLLEEAWFHGLLVFDPQTRALLGSVEVPPASGSISSLIRWAGDGLAFRSSQDELFVIRSALVPAGVLALRFPDAGVVGGGMAEGSVTLREPAPAGGSVITLRSDDPALAAVPAQVTVPAGAVTAAFPVTTAVVFHSTPVTFSASAGATSARAAMLLLPGAGVSMALRPAAVVGGALAAGTLTLRPPAPPGGLAVRLSSDHPAVAAVPPEIEFPRGTSYVPFSVRTSPVMETTPVTISAEYGGAVQRTVLTVLAPGPSAQSAAITRVLLPANDLIYDPFRDKIYASVPSTGGNLGNSLAVIDPRTGAIEGSTFAGSEPGKLALSDDGRYLYVALDGAAAVRCFDLAAGTAEPSFPLGIGLNGPAAVGDMKVAPGHPETLAVARVAVAPGSRIPAGVAIYDHGVALPTTTPSNTGPSVLAFSDSAARLYGYDNRTSEFGFYQMSVDPSGVFIQNEAPLLIDNFEVGIQYEDGLVYASSGRVIDPEALEMRGTYDGVPIESLMAADARLGRVFFLSREGTRWWLRAYEQRTFMPLGAVEIPGLSGAPGSLIRCGAGGLAFRAGAGQLFLVRTPLAPSDALSLTFDPEAAAGGLSVAGMITLGSPAPAGGAAIDLTSDRRDLVILPPRVVVPEGATTASFPIGTAPVAQATPVTVTATESGVSRTAVLSVRPEALQSISLSPASVAGGQPAAGTVELGLPAPTGGLLITLASDHPAVQVPATVSVPAGATTASFPVSTEPVPMDSTAVVSATLEGLTRAAALQVQAPVLLSVSVAPKSVTAGDRATGMVTISSPAPKDGLPITLGSGSKSVIVPDHVTVPAGAMSASFPVTTLPVDQQVRVSIVAQYGLANPIAYLYVSPRPVIAFSVSPTHVLSGNPATGTVTLIDPAPAGGAAVRLSSDHPDVVLVPPGVTVPAGATTASFPVMTQIPTYDIGVTLRAFWSGKEADTVLLVTDPIPVSLTLKPAAVVGGATVEATVTLDAPARAGGRLLRLSTDHPAAAGVPAQIVVPAGATTATFSVTTQPVTDSTVVTVTARTDYFAAVATLTVNPPPIGP